MYTDGFKEEGMGRVGIDFWVPTSGLKKAIRLTTFIFVLTANNRIGTAGCDHSNSMDPIHVGTAGKDLEDKEAKNAINHEQVDLEIPISKLEFKHLVKSKLWEEWQELWYMKWKGKNSMTYAQQLKMLI